MIRQKFSSCLLAVALAGVTVLSGCESQQKGPSEPEASMPWYGIEKGEGGATVVPKRTLPAATTTAPAPQRTGAWPTMRSSEEWAWSSLAYPTGDARTSSIGIEKGFPREVRANQPFEYQIIVTNLTDNDLTNVVVKDEVEKNLRLVSSSPAGQESAQGLHAWNLDTLGARQSKTIRINATPTAEGTVGSCATVEHDMLLCSSVPVVSPKLRLTKSGPAEVLKCEEIEYTFEIANTGTGTINDVKINDPLPTGLMTASGGRTLSFDAGSIAAGKAKTFTAKVKAERAGRFENKATATGGGLTIDSGAVATVVRQPVLKITKTCPGRMFVGRPITYEITVTNTGDGDARNTVIEDAMPSGAQFVSASDGGRAAGATVTWNIGTLKPNASKKVTFQVSPAGAGMYRNTATARAFCADAVSDSCETQVTGIPAILLEVVDIEDPDEVGTTETYVITVTNQGSATDTNIRIVCTLEPNQEYVSATGPTVGTARANTVTFQPLAALDAKQQATWRVTVRNVKAGDTRFKVSMNSDMLTRPVEETEATNIYE